MDENQETKLEETEQASNLKQETVKRFNEAKEQMKNINFKQEAEAGRGLVKKLLKNPVETIKEIADDKENKTFKTALLLVAAWAVIELVEIIIRCATSKYAEFEFLPTLKATLAPILTVIAMTLALYFVNNRAKESISKVLTSVTIAYIPSIVYSLIYLLHFISTKMYTILTPVGGLLRVVSVVLMYQTVKALSSETEEENVLKKFVKVQAVYYVIVFAVSFLGISI